MFFLSILLTILSFYQPNFLFFDVILRHFLFYEPKYDFLLTNYLFIKSKTMKKLLQFLTVFLVLIVSALNAQSQFSGAYSSPPTTPATIPYTCDFEDPTENANWQLSNDVCTNQWFIGTPSTLNPPISGGCLFISNDNGLTNAYTVADEGVVTATRYIQFSGANEYTLSFDLYIGGESTYDYIKVFVVDIDTNYPGLNGGTYPYYAINSFSLNQLLTNYNGTQPYFNGYNGSTIVPGSYPQQVVIPNQGSAGTVKKLIILWKNDTSGGTMPPASIDNISIVENMCARPSGLAVSNVTQTTAELSWVENGTANTWNVQYKLSTETNWNTITVTSNPYTISLNSSSTYEFRIQADCGSEQSLWTNNISATTLCGPVTQFPWSEGFEIAFPSAVAPGNAASPNCWINFNEGSSSYLWRRTTTSSYVRSGAGAAQHYTSSTGSSNDFLVTPVITLTGNERLRFYTKGYSSYVDHIKVMIYDITQNGQDVSSILDTALFTTILPNTFTGAADWMEHIIYLNNYIGDFRIAFVRDLVGGYYLNLDDVTIETIPTCPQPISSFLTLGETNTTINWVPANPFQTTFYLYYKEETATDYDSVLVGSTTYDLQNLTSGTTYNYYIKADCGIEFSEPTPVKTFKTLCSVITTLPVSESFDTYSTGTSAFPTCWYKLTTNPSYPSISATNSSPPGSLYTTLSYANGYALAISPRIDASIPLNTVKASLKFRASGLDDTLFVGVISDPYDITTYEELGFLVVTATGTFQDKEFYFSNYFGTAQHIAVKSKFGQTSSVTYIDDVVLDYVPTCANPTALYGSNILDIEATIGWVENGTATTWNIEYGPTGFVQGNGTLITGVASNPFTLTGLTAETSYQVYVQADCGGTLSPWSNPYTFTTACAPIMTMPYIEIFDTYGTGTGSFPTCWTKLSTSTTYPYISSTSFSGAGSLYLYNSASGNYNYAILPRIDASIPVNTLQVSFKFRVSGTDDTLYVGVMTDPTDMNTFTVVSSYTLSSTGTFVDTETLFGSYTGTGNYIAFLGSYGATSSTIYVDNVVVNYMPACPYPTNLTVSNITTSSVDLQWLENGSATLWNIEYGPVGFIPGTGTQLYSVYNNPITIDYLSPQTTYEFIVQADCGGTYSTWSLPVSATTACAEIDQLPWTDFFDTYGSGTSVFPTCWTRNTTYANRPYVNSTSYDGPGSLYFYTSTAGTYNIAATPQFAPQIPINTLMASFKYRTTNSTDTLYVGVMTDPMDASTFETISILRNTSTGTWYDKMVFFNEYIGIGQYIAFKVVRNGSTVYGYIDNLTIEPIPNCILPIDLTTSAVTSSSMDLDWTEIGSATSWNIEYGPVGFIQGTGTMLTNITTHPYNITGLNPQTAYQFYVQSNCGSELSSWSAPIVTMTGCGIITQLPYDETFDYYGTGTSAYPTCWTKVGSLATYPSISTNNATPPASLYLYCGSAGYFNYAISPQFDATIPVNTLRLEFKMRASGLDDTLYVGVMSSPTDTSTFELITQLTVPTTGVFDSYGINLNTYTGTGQYIVFKSRYGATSSAIYIDNLHIYPIPDCAKPIDLGATNVTDISADLYWTEDGNATLWNVEYGPTGFIPGTGIALYNLTDTFVSISGLSADTEYQFYAFADCGSGNISLPSNPYTFTTQCTPITTIPFVDNFDTYPTGSANFPTCWNKLSSYATNSYPYLSTTNFSSPASMYMYCGTSNSYNLVASPMFDPSNPINTLRVSLKMRASGLDDTLYVGVMTNYYDLNSFEVIQKITASATSVWEDHEVFLSSYTGTGNIIAFKTSYGATSSTIYVDNFVVDPIPSCPKPTALFASNVLTTEFTLGFTENGPATEWLIEYGPVGFIPGTGMGTTITGVLTNPYLVTGLTAQTTYDFYVRSVCGFNDESIWSDPLTVMTACDPITTLPWTDFFDTYPSGTTSFPTCWTRNTTVDNRPYVNTTNFSSPNSLYFYCGTAATYNIAATPLFEQPIQINTLKAEFKVRVSGLDDTLHVGVMTDPLDASTFETVAQIVLTATLTWQDVEVFFNNYTGTGKYIAFKTQYAATSSTLYLDNLSIDIIPSCPRPTNVFSSNATNTSATLEWTENGSATAWNIEYGPLGFTPGSGTIIPVTTNPFTLTGLTHSTCYDFYVQAACSPTDLSIWSNKATFCTAQIPVNVPFTIDFETPSGFQVANNSTGNNWYINSNNQ